MVFHGVILAVCLMSPVVLTARVQPCNFFVCARVPFEIQLTRQVSRMQLRPYQTRIVTDALAGNTIVILPTGAGKTLIAAELISKLGAPCLFLVPMCLLVEQQAQAVRDWTGLKG